MGPIIGVSNINENSSCLATRKQDQETPGEGEIKISGALSISLLRIVMRIAVLSMVSEVQTPVTQIVPVLTTSITLPRSPRWKHLRRRKHSGHSAPPMNQSIPAGCSDRSSTEKKLAIRPSWSRKTCPETEIPRAHRWGVDGFDPDSSDGDHSPLSVAPVWQLSLCPSDQENLWTARNPWGHHQYGGRVSSHGRSHRDVVDRLKQRLRRCAGGQWRVRTLFRRDRLEEHKVLDVPRKISTTGREEGVLICCLS